MSQRKYDTCVYLGRFQCPHLGHFDTMKKGLEIADKLIVCIGSHKRPRTLKNPWTSLERERMIYQGLAEMFGITNEFSSELNEIKRRVKFIHIRDHMYSNPKWATEVYSKSTIKHEGELFAATDDKRTCLIGHFKDDSSWYLNMFPQWDLVTVPNYKGINATDIRVDLFKNGKLSKESIKKLPECLATRLCLPDPAQVGTDLSKEHEFQENYQIRHAYADPEIPYTPIGVCADAVVVKSGHILMIRRKWNPGKGLWALPGGHLDGDETLVQTALRELKEETKIKVDKVVLENSIVKEKTRVFDHPRRSQGFRRITQVVLIDLGPIGALPLVKASDDAAGAHWIPLADLYEYEDKMFEDHSDIIKAMTSDF